MFSKCLQIKYVIQGRCRFQTFRTKKETWLVNTTKTEAIPRVLIFLVSMISHGLVDRNPTGKMSLTSGMLSTYKGKSFQSYLNLKYSTAVKYDLLS